MSESEFSFERLEVYQKSIAFVDNLFTVCNKFPQNLQYSLADHLRKTGISIMNNIAEGSDKRFANEKRRFYEHSLDSARECIPMLTICIRQNIITSSTHDKLREDCTVICRMLRRLIKSVI